MDHAECSTRFTSSKRILIFTSAPPLFWKNLYLKVVTVGTMRTSVVAVTLLCLSVASAQYFVNLGKNKAAAQDASVAKPAEAPAEAQAAGSKNVDRTADWENFVRWFRENGGIISSKLIFKVIAIQPPLAYLK